MQREGVHASMCYRLLVQAEAFLVEKKIEGRDRGPNRNSTLRPSIEARTEARRGAGVDRDL